MESLDKAPPILTVLDYLRARLGKDAFVVADHWEQDLYAVGIASPRNPRVLVYISNYGEAPNRYCYELELPPLPGDEFPYRVAGNGEDVTVEELASVVAMHFEGI